MNNLDCPGTIKLKKLILYNIRTIKILVFITLISAVVSVFNPKYTYIAIICGAFACMFTIELVSNVYTLIHLEDTLRRHT